MKKIKLKGFTLIELIVVISIIAILGGILIPKYVLYVNKAKEAKIEQVGRMIFTSSMRCYLNDEAFNKDDVDNAVKEDIGMDGLKITIEDPSEDGSDISADFTTDGLSYKIIIYGDSSSYKLVKE
jgi:type IV pilus assembly protein PilA